LVDVEGFIGFIAQAGIVLLIIIIYFARKSSKRKRRNQMRQQTQQYQHTIQATPQRTQTRVFRDLDQIIKELNITNQQQFERRENGFNFQVPENHQYSLFSSIRVVESKNYMKLFASLRKSLPSTLDIRRRESARMDILPTEILISQLSNVYQIYSESPAIWEEVLKNENSKEQLLALRTYIEFVYIRGDYVEAVVYYDAAVLRILEFVIYSHTILTTLFSGIDEYEVESLRCYNCGDPFDVTEEVCDKCNSPRPRCIICYLDLKRSDKEEVVTLPCCEIYSHKDHIISWLKQNPHCPNCHKNLSHWLNKVLLL
jgi:hypothetical protein